VESAVSVRAHFERFPATVKGAFVVRGEDANPHQVVIRSASAVSADGGASRPIELESVTLDVAPHIDVFVPFELAVTDLEPGWYELVCDGAVDGVAAGFRGAKRFVVAWPRSALRRGSVRVQRRLEAEGRSVKVDEIDCGGDSIKLRLIVDPPEPPELELSVDGDAHPVLDRRVDEATGVGLVTAYPLLRSHERLSIRLQGADPVEISLR
jgi:hypothetical protein